MEGSLGQTIICNSWSQVRHLKMRNSASPRGIDSWRCIASPQRHSGALADLGPNNLSKSDICAFAPILRNVRLRTRQVKAERLAEVFLGCAQGRATLLIIWPGRPMARIVRWESVRPPRTICLQVIGIQQRRHRGSRANRYPGIPAALPA